jgi:hypothetical protein
MTETAVSKCGPATRRPHLEMFNEVMKRCCLVEKGDVLGGWCFFFFFCFFPLFSFRDFAVFFFSFVHYDYEASLKGELYYDDDDDDDLLETGALGLP